MTEHTPAQGTNAANRAACVQQVHVKRVGRQRYRDDPIMFMRAFFTMPPASAQWEQRPTVDGWLVFTRKGLRQEAIQ